MIAVQPHDERRICSALDVALARLLDGSAAIRVMPFGGAAERKALRVGKRFVVPRDLTDVFEVG